MHDFDPSISSQMAEAHETYIEAHFQRRVVVIMGAVCSVAYQVCCFVAGLVLHNQTAVIFALITMGSVYLMALAQTVIGPKMSLVPTALLAASIFCGLAAGISLLGG